MATVQADRDGGAGVSAPRPPIPVDEAERLVELVATGILDTHRDQAFDDLVLLASTILETPVAMVNLIDADRQWTKAAHGIDADVLPREDAFCSWALDVGPDDLFVVPDAALDARFDGNSLVTGDPGIRFYAGAVLRSRTGQGLGALCVIDRAPRAGLSAVQADQLRLLGRQASRLLEASRLSKELARAEAWARAVLEGGSDIVLVLDATGTITYASEALERILGWSVEARAGTPGFDLVHPDDLSVVAEVFARRVEEDPEDHLPLEFRVCSAAGEWIPVEALSTNRFADPDVAGVVVHLRDVTYRREVEARVQRGERALADAQRVARMGSWELDVATGAHQWSDGLFRLLGLDPRSTSPSQELWTATMRPDERETMRLTIIEAIEGGKPFAFRRHLVRPDGEERIVLVQGEVDVGPDGTPLRVRGALLDVHDAAVAEAALEDQRQFLETVLDTLDESIVACDADGRLTLFNPAARELHGRGAEPGLAPEEWARHYGLYDVDGTTPLAVDDVPLLRALRDGAVRTEVVIATAGEAPKLMSCTGCAISGAEGERVGAVVAMRDITAERAAEVQLRRLADHDLLTGLPNRAVFANRLEAALTRGDQIAVLFLDLDRFKDVNDEHGHNVGDQVLATAARRMAAAVKATDTAARIGGDEFVVLLQGVDGPEAVATVAARIESSLSEPMVIGGQRLSIAASVGVAIPEPGEPLDGEALLARADRAMYQVKGRRHG